MELIQIRACQCKRQWTPGMSRKSTLHRRLIIGCSLQPMSESFKKSLRLPLYGCLCLFDIAIGGANRTAGLVVRITTGCEQQLAASSSFMSNIFHPGYQPSINNSVYSHNHTQHPWSHPTLLPTQLVQQITHHGKEMPFYLKSHFPSQRHQQAPQHARERGLAFWLKK